MQLKNIKIGQWSKRQKKDSILIGLQIQLRRNLNNYPFRNKITDSQEKIIITQFTEFYQKNPYLKSGKFSTIKNLSLNEKLFLVEENYLTLKIDQYPNSAVLILPKLCASIILNTDEHFKIIVNDTSIEKAYKTIELLDNLLTTNFEIAYNSKLGFLTSSANYLSNGMQIKASLHLPSLHRTDKIDPLHRNLKKSLYNLNDYFDIPGTDYYTFSNTGKKFFLNPEQEVLNLFRMDLSKVIKEELAAKKELKKNLFYLVEDEILRIYGILKYAKFLEFNETLHHIGSLLFGIELDIIDLPKDKLRDLFMLIHPGHIRILDESIKTQVEEDIFRAYIVQKELL